MLHALRAALPDRDFVYLGDHAHAPYGERTPEEILALTCDAVDRLFALGCPLVVIACNTAAAVALRRLQQDWLPKAWPERRVLGVFVPMVEAITGVPWNGNGALVPPVRAAMTVGVFATPRTILTCAWRNEIRRRAPWVTVVQQQCPGLAALIEEDPPGDAVAGAVARHVAGLMPRLPGPLDAVVLGCTHYPLVAGRFADALPAPVRILDQPAEVARSLTGYLSRHPRFARRPGEDGAVRFLTTGDPARAGWRAARFLGEPATFEAVGTELGLPHPAGAAG